MRRWLSASNSSDEACPCVLLFSAVLPVPPGLKEPAVRMVEKAVTGYEQSKKSAEKFIAQIDKYENFDTLTNTMLNEFVEKILVHERSVMVKPLRWLLCCLCAVLL